MQRILITGGSGFIGSHLVDALERQSYCVTVLDQTPPSFHNSAHFIAGSVTDRQLVSKVAGQSDAVIHLAAILGTHETVERAYETTAVNVLGTINVLDAAREHSLRLLYVSKPQLWCNPYTITKAAAETYCVMYRDTFGMDVRIARCFNVYGPRQASEREGLQKAVPTFIRRAIRSAPLPIFGDGNQTTDHIFVEDAVRAIVALLESVRVPQQAIEIGSGDEITVKKLAEAIILLTGAKSNLEYLPMRVGESPHAHVKADTSSMRTFLGFLPRVPLIDGLNATIEYYRHLDGLSGSSEFALATEA